MENLNCFAQGNCVEDRYVIEDVRHGARGIIYLCKDLKTSNPVAIKTFNSTMFDSETIRSNFVREATKWIRLDRHPNIVHAICLKMYNEKPHLLIERVCRKVSAECSLKHEMQTQSLSLKQICRIGISICDGMIHVNQTVPGWVHRDLKLENILIGDDNIPKITDFGMTMKIRPEDQIHAASHASKPKFPRLSELVYRMEGTPEYASPEQCLGNRVDTRSDIYSFGCMLYYLSSTMLPFRKQSVKELIHAQIHEHPLPPANRQEHLPLEWVVIVMKCLEKSPAKRFQSFQDLRDALSDFYEERYDEHACTRLRR